MCHPTSSAFALLACRRSPVSRACIGVHLATRGIWAPSSSSLTIIASPNSVHDDTLHSASARARGCLLLHTYSGTDAITAEIQPFFQQTKRYSTASCRRFQHLYRSYLSSCKTSGLSEQIRAPLIRAKLLKPNASESIHLSCTPSLCQQHA